MSAIKDLIGKSKGNPAYMIGSLIGILVIAFAIGTIAGSILIYGLNLMGLSIPYTMKTIAGSAIVICCLRSIGSSSK